MDSVGEERFLELRFGSTENLNILSAPNGNKKNIRYAFYSVIILYREQLQN